MNKLNKMINRLQSVVTTNALFVVWTAAMFITLIGIVSVHACGGASKSPPKVEDIPQDASLSRPDGSSDASVPEEFPTELFRFTVPCNKVYGGERWAEYDVPEHMDRVLKGNYTAGLAWRMYDDGAPAYYPPWIKQETSVSIVTGDRKVAAFCGPKATKIFFSFCNC